MSTRIRLIHDRSPDRLVLAVGPDDNPIILASVQVEARYNPLSQRRRPPKQAVNVLSLGLFNSLRPGCNISLPETVALLRRLGIDPAPVLAQAAIAGWEPELVQEAAQAGLPALPRELHTRPVEMYVGLMEGDTGTWYTTYVEIPIDTPETAIETVACALLGQKLVAGTDNVAFWGVYHIPSLDDLIGEGDWLDAQQEES